MSTKGMREVLTEVRVKARNIQANGANPDKVRILAADLVEYSGKMEKVLVKKATSNDSQFRDHGGSSFLDLPPEIRNLIYHYLLVEPHQGYVKCEIEGNHSDVLVCRADLQILRANRQINLEARSIFNGVNTFALTQRKNKKKNFKARLESFGRISIRYVTKLHVFVRDCQWKSDFRRTSPQVDLETAKECISILASRLWKPHKVQYLLIDCLSGFGASALKVMNLLRPLQSICKIPQVHIVSSDKDHFPYLRYLEKGMMGRSKLLGTAIPKSLVLRQSFDKVKDKTAQAKAGNELARILHVDPCYPTEASAGKK